MLRQFGLVVADRLDVLVFDQVVVEVLKLGANAKVVGGHDGLAVGITETDKRKASRSFLNILPNDSRMPPARWV